MTDSWTVIYGQPMNNNGKEVGNLAGLDRCNREQKGVN